MRASEVLSLTREQVDVKGKVVILPDTKNGDRRVVPLQDEVIVVFQRRAIPLDRWFTGRLGNLDKGFRKAAQKANLSGVTFHTLRHTFASYAVMAGVNLHTLAKLLGHRNLQMTQRYAHLAPAHLHTAAAQAASVIFAANMPHAVPHTPDDHLQISENTGEKRKVA